ncbi:hypothetical protein [Acidovorax sp.]|uniref:hypothetical protein n=1 Tax=Acidovorax sp. TaxID=1872122 RepID=UPI00391F8DB4
MKLNPRARPRPISSLPLAAPGLLSFRLALPHSFIMIGAKDEADAMIQAARSTPKPRMEDLQRWDGQAYVPCRSSAATC